VDMPSLMAAIPFNGINGKINLDRDRDIVSTIPLAKVDKNRNVIEIH
jgi:hypothetical protein